MIRVVVSAVNFTEGGPLTVLRDCLATAAATLPAEFEIVAIINRDDLINVPRVRLITISSAKKSWFFRLYWEWFGFYKISRRLNASLWLSLHDITPRVKSVRQVVYCHNPSPFYKVSLREAWLEPNFFIFNKLYFYLYKILIHRNYFIIIQQDWLRKEFRKRIGELPIVVAHPSIPFVNSSSSSALKDRFVFLYPALPRVFKNIEILCLASKILNQRGVHDFEIRLTLNGLENRYARWLFNKYSGFPNILFIGRQSANEMVKQYKESSSIVFPSKLETWGLPITEAKAYQLPLLVADCAYARETVGTYDSVSFFPPNSPESLANLMQSMIQNIWTPDGNQSILPNSPYVKDWESLWQLLTDGLSTAQG